MVGRSSQGPTATREAEADSAWCLHVQRTDDLTVRLAHADATDVAVALNDLLADASAGGVQRVRVQEDPRTNSVLIHADGQQHAMVEQLIEALDVEQ